MIPDEASLARHIKRTQQSDGVPSGTAYELREDENSLSMDWLEQVPGPTLHERLANLKNLSTRTFKPSSYFGIHVKGELVHYVEQEAGVHLTVHNDQDPTPSHCSVKGYTHEDKVVAQIIADCVSEMVKVGELKT